MWLAFIAAVVILPALVLVPWFLADEYSKALSVSLLKESLVNLELEKDMQYQVKHILDLLENKSDAISYDLAHKNNIGLIDEFLKIIIEREELIHGLLVVSASGRIEAAIDRAEKSLLKTVTLKNKADQKWLENHWGVSWKNISNSAGFDALIAGQKHISEVNAHEGRHMFRVSFPLLYKKSIQGVLIAEIEVEAFWKKFKKQTDNSENTSYLIDRRGVLLVNVENEKFRAGDKLTHINAVSEAIEGNIWPANDAYQGLSGQPVYGTTRPLALLDWILVSEINQQVIVEPIVSTLIKVVFVIALIVIMFLLLGLRMMRSVSRPIENLTTAIQLFSQDRAQFKKIPATNVSELNTVVDVFNRMLDERSRMDEAVKKSRDRLMLHRQQSPLGIIEWNTRFEFLDWNPAAERMFGYKKEEVLGRHITETILPESARVAVDIVWNSLLTQSGGLHSVNENMTKDGRTILCEWNNTPLVDESGEVVGVNSYVLDITQQKLQEDRLRQSQKMEALNKLTGGVSHDFNNLLNAILGYAELIVSKSKDEKIIKYASVIADAGTRGAKLTKKLLRFSSNEAHELSVVDVNAVINDEYHMLEKALTSRIDLVLDMENQLWPVNIDSADLQDAILNMSINSMHAIAGNGNLTISTSNIRLNESSANQLNLERGDYVRLQLTDTGCGMDDETLNHIFDPFFTTKGEMGTGLGLSQVYGFVKRAGGTLIAKSEINAGTEFSMYLPRYIETESDVAITLQQESEQKTHLKGNESILVVDDEKSLRDLCVVLLEGQGYEVTAAKDGEQALSLLEQHSFALVLSDVVMPNMDGYMLAREIQRRWPEIKIQLVSGFTDGLQVSLEDESLHQNLIQKPYKLDKLLKRIRELLDA